MEISFTVDKEEAISMLKDVALKKFNSFGFLYKVDEMDFKTLDECGEDYDLDGLKFIFKVDDKLGDE